MKIKITTLLMLFLSLASTMLFGQKIEIVVVASSHQNNPGDEDYKMVIDKLKRFKPDIVQGEYLSPEDYNSLEPGTYAFEGLKKAKLLVGKSYPGKLNNLDKKIASANRSLAKFPYYHKLRMDLASYYVLKGDRANAEYQFYLLENEMKKRFGKEELAYYATHFGNQDSLKKVRIYRPLSEYTNIYFPLLQALKQDKIYAMDCQMYDRTWSAAWGRADSAYKVLKTKAEKDTTSAEAKTYAAIQAHSELTAEDKKLMSKSPYQNMAQDRYAELNDVWNFYGGSHFYGWPGFPEKDIKAMFVQWNLRNEGMSANILRQAKEQKATRVIVGVGAAHRKILEVLLAKDPDVKIISYRSLL
jgi:hypothetical protein